MKSVFKKKGFSLLELLIALGVFGILASSTAIFTLQAIQANKNTAARTKAYFYVQEIQNALNYKKKESWKNVTVLTNAGTKHLAFVSGQYQFVDGAGSVDGFSTSIQITPAYRDASDNLIEGTSGTQDPESRRVAIQIGWTDAMGISRSLTSNILITDWNVSKWTQTAANEFDLGVKDFVVSDTTDGGILKMENIAYPDWCRPRLSTTQLNLPGSAIANAVTAIEGRAFVGTGSTSPSVSNPSFINVGVSNTKPPVAAVDGQFNNIKVNSVFGEGSYAFLATDNDSEEVQILDLTTASPYTRVGWFNAPGTSNANSIYTVGTKGYVTTVDSKLYVFDLSSKIGSRGQLGVKTLMGEGSEVQVVGNNAYVSITGGAHIELQLVDVANPASMYTVGVGNTSQSDATDLFVDTTGNRAYVGTASSASEKEFIIFNTANKATAQNQSYFQESSGQVVIEAEHYDTNLTRGGKSWTVQTGGSPAGASGNEAMVAGPDTGTTISSDYFRTSPELGYRVNFTTTGTYYFWVRAYANNANNNNVHGGYDGANFPNVEALNTTSYNSWRWFKGSISITTPEIHWINVWMQDDGFRLDKIMLTTNSGYTPSNSGPAESTRTTASIVAPELNRQLGQYETTGMSIEGVTVLENNTRAILVGTGAEEYQVVNLDDESAPVRCAGLEMNSGINAIASVKEADEDSYSYLITRDTASEFKVIRGGAGYDPSQGGNYDEEYNLTGSFESQSFDTGSTATQYDTMTWQSTVPAGTTVSFQIRTGNTPVELAANPWFGTDGTAGTYFIDPNNSIIPVTAHGKRYIQYKAFFTSDGTKTPVVQGVDITYEI